jgi:protein-S-isoprenylcysteine O-methyltransferase Ste14
MSAFYLVAYSSLSVPAIVAGVLTTPLGLNATFEVFGSVIACVALLVAALAWRTRPRVAPLASAPETAAGHHATRRHRLMTFRECPAAQGTDPIR